MTIDNKLILEHSKNLNILYVEDDAQLREVTGQLFQNFFNHIDLACDGLDGYQKYKEYNKENNKYYDIVITDVNMPNLDGLEMSKKIKALNDEQAIIVISAFNELKYLNNAIKIGVNGFLTKPIKMDELKEVFYTTSLYVSDKELEKKYYEQIVDRNMLTINQEDASSFTSSKDIIKTLEANKEHISKLWTDKELVHERLESHTIDVEYFRKHYAIKVIEYFLNVIKGDAEIGNCPVIFVMLDFFKNKKLPLEDIFMMCVLFKNTITAYIFDRYTFNHKLFDDISLILDKNFEGVVVNYLKLNYIPIVEDEPKEEQVVAVVEEDIPAIRKEEEESVNYAEYVLESDIYELQDLEEDIDNLSISVTGNGSVVDDSVELGDKINRYGNILGNYPLFSELGKYISKLGINLSENSQVLGSDPQKMENISALIEGFVNDLIVWRKEVFENNILNPHFLDSSFFSNVDTIIIFIEYDESATAEEEYFDDMFF